MHSSRTGFVMHSSTDNEATHQQARHLLNHSSGMLIRLCGQEIAEAFSGSEFIAIVSRTIATNLALEFHLQKEFGKSAR